MKLWLMSLFTLATITSLTCLAAGPTITMKNAEPQAFLGKPMYLYPDDTERQQGDAEQWGHLALSLPNGYSTSEYFIRNVTNPALYTFLPPSDIATGTAVIIAPGGAFMSLAVQNEGLNVAKALNKQGIAAFVLTYTLNQTSTSIDAYQEEVGKIFAAKGNGQVPDIFVHQAPQDALKALTLLKTNAARWNIEPDKIGFLGFSAGAMTSLSAATASTDIRPAFLGYIYGPMKAIEVPHDAPPMFTAIALDDGLFGKQGFGIVKSWQAQNIPVELHAYEKGDHGFGVGRPGTTSTGIIPQFTAWLASHNL